MVKGTASPYDRELDVYWSLRTETHGGFNTRERTLLKRQKGFCTWCKGPIKDSIVEVDHIIPKKLGGRDEYSNLQLLHRVCHTQKTSSDMAKKIL